ncbi:gliding motility-associated C-terminal domain-containing protein [Hymenobacter daecheongensis DSM 21074]|uniref:Gliding motility-associated C-terminal domain-containing protein n=1 Tax=Hymenobacter daecheongensis DSM 21074 TaxID=1121955 RepID=A0A1M6LGL9_9BACT|nr:gliding motility-associated C-terminal domain-containing protein [Hymenobacter daecheongensis]SHJ70330.1 gliding motility-associated C-terminal domain-containing protein [Hymenobacter daecheongensis DSM 21074]
MLVSTIRYCLFLAATLAALRTTAARPVHVAPAQTLEFIENKGQWDARAHYVAALPAGRLFVAPTGFTYSFVSPAALRAHHEHAAQVSDRIPAHAYTVTFEGGNARAALSPEQPTTEHRNYFLGKDPQHWASDVRGFRQLQYADIYPGIGARLYENATQQLEYDFTVEPGARPERIRLRYSGVERLVLKDGNLLISTSVGFVTEQAPRAWQLRGTRRVPVACRFELTGTTVSFHLGRYNPRLPLIIDPTVIFSSFTGSTADNWGFTATYDAQGNMYSGGVAFEPGYPASPGAFDLSFNGNVDIAIMKYNTSVSGPAARLYATYLGGFGSEAPHSLEVNSQDELVILGSTSSSNYPVTTNAYDVTFNGGPSFEPLSGISYPAGSDLVITKLRSNGSALLASTYLGGTGTDGLLATPASVNSGSLVQNYGDQFRGDVITDGAGNVYLASSTSSFNFPVPNGYQTTLRGGTDAVVCKLSADLRTLVWSTFLGSSSADAAYSIQIDAARSVYVSGGTQGNNFPTTAGSLHPTSQGGTDGFVAHLSSSGNALLQSSYIGTSATDQAYFLQLDAGNNVYLLGQTAGTYPVTTGLYAVRGARQFIQKLNPTLSANLYSTTFGVAVPTGLAPHISPTAFLVDDCERIYVCGWGGSVNYDPQSIAGFPVTANAIQRTSDGSDFYLAQFTPGMLALEYATFFGENGGRSGEHVDGGTSRFDKRGLVYQAVCGGCGGSSGFPVPPGAGTYSNTNKSSNCNNAAFKIDFGQRLADPGPNRYVCVSAAPVVLGGTPAGGTWSGPGVSVISGGGYQFTPSPALLGRQVLTYSVASTGTCVSTRPLRMTVLPETPATFAPLPAVCIDGAAITLVASPPGGTFSGPGVAGSTFSPATAGVGTFTLRYSLNDTVSCNAATQTVVVKKLPDVTAGNDTTLCADQLRPFQLRGMRPAGGTWSGPSVSAAGLFTPPNTNNKGAILTLRYSIAENGCLNSAPRQIVLAPASVANVRLNVPECQSAPEYTGLAPFTCTFEPVLPGGTYQWSFGDGTPTSDEAGPTHTFTEPGTYLVRLTARYAGCEVLTQFAPVVVGEVFVPNIITPNGDSINDRFQPRFSCRPARLQVFTRWGNKVFETADYHNNWRGENLPDGVYYYYLVDADERKARGWVEVKRQL